MKHTSRVVMGAAPFMWAAMAFGVGPSVRPLPDQVVESQMEVFTGGVTYEEYLDRQAALHARLVEEMPPAALQAQVVVQLTPAQINSLTQPVSTTPLQIGVVAPIAPKVQIVGLNRAQSAKQPDGGLVWALPLASPDAGAIRVHIENMSLPPNTELYFYSLAGEAFGPYTGAGPNGTGEFWTQSVFGSEGILQLRVPGPTDAATLRQISLSVTEVGHIGARFTGDLVPVIAASFCGNVACIVDASCYSGANATKDAIAKMEWVKGAFIYTCTTGLIADTDTSTVKNYCLTANHCISSSGDAANINFYWRFRTSSCNGTCPSNSGWPYKTAGAVVRATGAGSAGDFTLLEANTAPPSGSVYMAFSNAPVANTNGVALHRVSNPIFGPQVYSEQSVDTSAGTCNGLPRGPIIYSRDTLGGTDGGSSGSPVCNSSNQVVGQLYGACGTNVNDPCDSVSNATIDGAMAYYWPSVCPFLNPGNCTGGCGAAGTSCTSNSQCCSNNCKGKTGSKTCK